MILVNLGELAGIVLLVYEILQSTENVQAQTYRDRSQIAHDFWLTVADSEYLAPIYEKMEAPNPDGAPVDLIDRYQNLSAGERGRVKFSQRALIRQFDNVQMQYEIGLITEDFYQNNILRGVRFYGRLWKKIIPGYGTESFNQAVERVLKEASQTAQ